MDPITTEITKTAVAVPGSLGIILSVSTFVFCAWLIRYVLKTNEKREDRLASLIEKDLSNQKSQLDRLEEGHKFQRAEHQALLENQNKYLLRQDATAQILERLVGMLSGTKLEDFKINKG